MPIKTYADAKSQFESSLAVKQLSPEEYDAKIKKFNQMYSIKRQEVLDQEVAAQKAATQGSYLKQGASMVGAATLGVLDTAFLGHLPTALSSVGLEKSAGKIDLATDIAKETNPYATGLGQFGGYFVGPAGLTAKLAGRAASTATGTKALAAAAAERHFAIRAMTHGAQNIASGTGAVVAERMVEARDDGADLQQRMAESVEVVKSPMFLALSLGGGALSAKFTHRPPPDFKRLFNKFERLTGQKVPVEVYTDSKSMQDAFEALRHVPGVSNDAVKAVRGQQKALISMVDEMIAKHGLPTRGRSEQTAARAAAAARRLSGVGEEAGLVTRIRKGQQARAAQQFGGDTITPEATKSLRSSMANMIAKRSRRVENVGKRGKGTGRPGDGTSTQAYIDRIRRLTNSKSLTPIDVKEMEVLRRGLSKISKWDSRMAADATAHSDEAVREARMMYDMLGSAIKQSSKTYHEVAIEAGRGLRAIEASLPRIKVDKVDDAIIEDFLTGPGVFTRLESLQKYGTGGDFEQVMGHMVGKLIRESQNPKTGVISASRMQSKLSSMGSTNRQIFDKFLPGLRQELADSAAISEEMVKGLMKAEGSVTSRKGPWVAAAATSGAAGMVYMHNLLTNPMGTIGSTLGAIGIQALLTKGIRSTVVPGGQINQTLQGLARGAPGGLSRLPVAASQTPIPGFPGMTGTE